MIFRLISVRKMGLLLALVPLLLVFQPTAAAVRMVTNTNDSGSGSLREAITLSNVASDVDTIQFSIGSGVQTITLLTQLPIITNPITIDGTTQNGFNGTPLIEINGNAKACFILRAGNSVIRSLSIFNCSINGIYVEGLNSTNITIAGNYVGIRADGITAFANGQEGITLAVPQTTNNVIGGTTVADRNVISGNGLSGISLDDVVNNKVIGNYIGVSADGTTAVPNGGYGVLIYDRSDYNIIGGAAPGEGNLISGNTLDGVSLQGTGTVGNQVLGNHIGTNAAGTAALPNGRDGINLAGVYDSIIGGAASGAGNLISGNVRYGIELTGYFTRTNIIQGNFIGTDVTGLLPLGNGQDGIRIEQESRLNVIGGTASGAGNTIAYNGGMGIYVTTGAGNVMRRNLLFANTGLGIDLHPIGVTPNDLKDADDDNGNLNQNYPLLTSKRNGVTGTLNSLPSTTFAIELFQVSSCDPFGNGEAETYLGTLDVTTDTAGNAAFSWPMSLVVGDIITATATDPQGNTSEFSACAEVEPSPPDAAPSANVYDTATPTLTWLGVSWAMSYELQINTNASFTGTMVWSDNNLTSGYLHTVIDPLPDGVYYWRIRAKKADGTMGVWSPVDRFEVLTP